MRTWHEHASLSQAGSSISARGNTGPFLGSGGGKDEVAFGGLWSSFSLGLAALTKVSCLSAVTLAFLAVVTHFQMSCYLKSLEQEVPPPRSAGWRMALGGQAADTSPSPVLAFLA